MHTGNLALSLLMAFVLGTDNHNLAVSLNYLAFIAHRLYRRSNFHFSISVLFFVNIVQRTRSVRGIRAACRTPAHRAPKR